MRRTTTGKKKSYNIMELPWQPISGAAATKDCTQRPRSSPSGVANFEEYNVQRTTRYSSTFAVLRTCALNLEREYARTPCKSCGAFCFYSTALYSSAFHLAYKAERFFWLEYVWLKQRSPLRCTIIDYLGVYVTGLFETTITAAALLVVEYERLRTGEQHRGGPSNRMRILRCCHLREEQQLR